MARGNLRDPTPILSLVIASTRRVRGNLSFGVPNTPQIPEIASSGQKTLLLAMTLGRTCGPWEPSLRGSFCEPKQSPRADCHVSLFCHCETRFVSRGNLAFGFPTVLSLRGSFSEPKQSLFLVCPIRLRYQRLLRRDKRRPSSQ